MALVASGKWSVRKPPGSRAAYSQSEGYVFAAECCVLADPELVLVAVAQGHASRQIFMRSRFCFMLLL